MGPVHPNAATVRRLLAGWGVVQPQLGSSSGNALGTPLSLGPPGLWSERDTARGGTDVLWLVFLGKGRADPGTPC